MENAELVGQRLSIDDSEEESYTEVDLFDDEDAYIYDNQLSFENDENGELELVWKGTIDDFYTGSDEPTPFKLKCHFRPDELEVDED